MGKRKRSRSRDSESLRKRLKKLEKKLLEKEGKEKSRDESDCPASPGTPPLPIPDPNVADEVEDLTVTGDDIPEDLLQALGEEGEHRELVGEDIKQQLADRWTNIIHQGLGREAREKLMKKYQTPANFTAAIPPKMNQEIGATMSDSSNKRDKRIMFRQTLVGKMMISLGRALTSVLKGNLNTKEIVEQINDSAKLAAEVYYQDSSSRKFFALAGTTPVIKEAVKNGKTDEYLFGKNCGDQIKAAQVIERTSAQIKAKDFKQRGNRQENWKSPLQPQPQYRSGQPHRPPVRGRVTQPAQRAQGMQRKPPQSQKTFQSRYRRY